MGPARRETGIGALAACAVVVLVASCATYGCGPRKRTIAAGTSAMLAGGLTSDERIGAMMRIRAHVSLPHASLLDLPSLEVATKNLARDEGVRAASRKRRAIAALAARRLTLEASSEFASRRDEIDDALARLGMDSQRMTTLRSTIINLPDITAEEITVVDFDILEMEILKILVTLFPDLFAVPEDAGVGVDCWTPAGPTPSVTPVGQAPVVLETSVSVDLPIEETARNIDPQSWDDCSEFWDLTEPVEWQSGKYVGFTPPNDPGEHATQQMLLHEQFDCGALCGNARFDLLLCVATRCDPLPATGVPDCATIDEFAATYDLPRGQEGDCTCVARPCPRPCDAANTRWWFNAGQVGNQATMPCTDDGSVHATVDPSDPNRTLVRAVKNLHFDDSALTDILATTLSLYLDEMNRELGELACCLPN